MSLDSELNNILAESVAIGGPKMKEIVEDWEDGEDAVAEEANKSVIADRGERPYISPTEVWIGFPQAALEAVAPDGAFNPEFGADELDGLEYSGTTEQDQLPWRAVPKNAQIVQMADDEGDVVAILFDISPIERPATALI